jgi:predicted Fe-Mo cluster-binding NifX family protein
MKIAVATDDGEHVSQHFGRAAQYVVLTVDDDQIVSRETRAKPVRHHAPGEHHDHRPGEGGHDHASMIEPILDCQVLLAGGMGSPAYESMRRAGVVPILTDEPLVEAAALAYAGGRLANHPELLH